MSSVGHIGFTRAADGLAQRFFIARVPDKYEMETEGPVADDRSFLMQKERKTIMHPTMFPLLVMNILENHATKEHPLTITEITNFVNQEFAPFAMEKDRVINRSTVMRILDTMEFWTDGNLFNFRVVQCGTEGKKLFCLER